MRTVLVGLFIAGAVTPGGARAQDRNVEWLRRPTPDMLTAVWPSEAWRRGLTGRAIIACKVSIQGALFDCKVDKEEPAGSGFGAAGIALTPQLLMKPALRDGRPVEGDVRIPINFSAPPGQMIGGSTVGMRDLYSAAQAWPLAPTYQDVIAAYPAKAKAAGVGGLVSLNCEVKVDRLSACRVMREEPKGHGFLAAARELTKKFVAEPFTGGRAAVNITFAFTPQMLTSDQRVTGKPTWAKLPTTEAFQAAFPRNSAAGTIRVAMSCRIEQAGLLSGCNVANEDPPARGYGAAALKLAGDFRVATWSVEGFPIVGSTVRVPIRFEIGGQDPAAAPPAAAPPAAAPPAAAP
ncbi:energy transducer TonB [Phenylobacterium sp.]|jgi:hypothetical protein|uniref:energy transducer TonB n=1 Tax=Phenylobacterium sp. TaxID=1871053 RepID=UPI0037850432